MNYFSKNIIWFLIGTVITIIFFVLLLIKGAVNIPPEQVFSVLFGGEAEKNYWGIIIIDNRLPMAITSMTCGSALSVAGLIMQTTFHNPLAGPSVLGVSSGASLGVAAILLGGMINLFPNLEIVATLFGALIGSALIILVLILFSSLMRSGVILLVIGIMISYLASSIISLMNYFSPAEEIRNYLFWGLGSFSGLQLDKALILLIINTIIILLSYVYVKPLNSLLIGERYAESLGYSVPRLRIGLLIITGALVAFPTAFCGPIGFIGLIVPHLCRLLFRSSNHIILHPACIIFGALISLGCTLISILPSAEFGIIPINVITPIIGIPIIIYLLIFRKRIVYLS